MSGLYYTAIRGLPSFTITDWDVNANGVFDNTDLDTRMNYTPAMRALIRAYKKSTSIEKNAVYLFMVPYNCTDTRLQGFMPFNL